MKDKIKADLALMSPYERYKLALDFIRFLAMIGAPFIAVWINKNWI